MELPVDVLTIISEFSKPLKRRLISQEWYEYARKKDMLEAVDDWLEQTLDDMIHSTWGGFRFGVDLQIMDNFDIHFQENDDNFEYKISFMKDGETEDEFIYLRFDIGELYEWDTTEYSTSREGYSWHLCPSENFATQFINDNGRVVNTKKF
jgi:hypothetical protein